MHPLFATLFPDGAVRFRLSAPATPVCANGVSEFLAPAGALAAARARGGSAQEIASRLVWRVEQVAQGGQKWAAQAAGIKLRLTRPPAGLLNVTLTLEPVKKKSGGLASALAGGSGGGDSGFLLPDGTEAPPLWRQPWSASVRVPSRPCVACTQSPSTLAARADKCSPSAEGLRSLLTRPPPQGAQLQMALSPLLPMVAATGADGSSSSSANNGEGAGYLRSVTVLSKDSKTGAWAKCVAPRVTLADRTPPAIAVADTPNGWSSGGPCLAALRPPPPEIAAALKKGVRPPLQWSCYSAAELVRAVDNCSVGPGALRYEAACAPRALAGGRCRVLAASETAWGAALAAARQGAAATAAAAANPLFASVVTAPADAARDEPPVVCVRAMPGSAGADRPHLVSQATVRVVDGAGNASPRVDVRFWAHPQALLAAAAEAAATAEGAFAGAESGGGCSVPDLPRPEMFNGARPPAVAPAAL